TYLFEDGRFIPLPARHYMNVRAGTYRAIPMVQQHAQSAFDESLLNEEDPMLLARRDIQTRIPIAPFRRYVPKELSINAVLLPQIRPNLTKPRAALVPVRDRKKRLAAGEADSNMICWMDALYAPGKLPAYNNAVVI